LAKILVVDDDPVMQMTMGRVLEQAGHRPPNGAALLAMVADCLTSVNPRTAQSSPDRDAISNS